METSNNLMASREAGAAPVGQNGGSLAGVGDTYGPIRASNLYVVDAQGFTINGEFHARELWVTNPIMSWGIHLDLDVSFKDMQRIPMVDFNRCSRQTDKVHGLHFRSRRHSMNRSQVGSRQVGFLLSMLYDTFAECANQGEPPVFCVKNYEVLRVMKKESNIKRIVNLDDPSFGFPNIETLETYYAEWKTQCFCHQMQNRSLYRCSQSKNNIIFTHLMKNNYLDIVDRELFGTALGNMTTTILDSRFFDGLIRTALEARRIAQPGGQTPAAGRPSGEEFPNPDGGAGASALISTGTQTVDDTFRKQDESWTIKVEVPNGDANEEGLLDSNAKRRCRRGVYWSDEDVYVAPEILEDREFMRQRRFGY